MLRFVTSPSKLGLSIMLAIAFMVGAIIAPERSTADKVSADPMFDASLNAPLNAPSSDPLMVAPTAFVKKVGQMSVRIRSIAGEQWFVCGEQLSVERSEDVSVAIANSLLTNIESVGLDVEPMGVLATMYNESGFDPCALGTTPRKWAQGVGLLKKKKRTISYSRAEVLGVVNDQRAIRRFAGTGFDLGLCQILSKYYRGEKENLLSIGEGARLCVIEMQSRARMYRTSTPWLYWRGKETAWYRIKIRKWAMRMGATSSEMRGI